MKENTICILTYMLLVAAFDFMIGWVCGQQVCRRKNAEQQLAELTNNLPRACSGTKAQLRQFKELRSVLNDAHKHIVAVSKSPKNPRPLNHAKSMAGSHRSGRSKRCGFRNKCAMIIGPKRSASFVLHLS